MVKQTHLLDFLAVKGNDPVESVGQDTASLVRFHVVHQVLHVGDADKVVLRLDEIPTVTHTR